MTKKLCISKRIRDCVFHKERFYHPVELPKEDGSKRTVYNVINPLKAFHLKIKEAVFDGQNLYPHYLHGGISDRSIVTNARTHLKAKSLIVMDIKKYFPSIKEKDVRRWFCKQGYKDADLLANLLTLNNELPQGACTSSALANLVLFGEREMAKEFETRGYRYSRYVDDIAVSSNKGFSTEEVEEIKSKVSSVIEKNQFSIHCQKTKVYHASDNDKDDMFMVVTGIGVDGKKLRISTRYYNVLKGIISNLVDYHENEESIQGKIAYVQSIDTKKAQELRALLSQRLQGVRA